MSPEAIHGTGGAYVPCDELPAELPPLPAGAIVGQAAGFVARNEAAAVLPTTPHGAIRGSQVGFVPEPCVTFVRHMDWTALVLNGAAPAWSGSIPYPSGAQFFNLLTMPRLVTEDQWNVFSQGPTWPAFDDEAVRTFTELQFRTGLGFSDPLRPIQKASLSGHLFNASPVSIDFSASGLHAGFAHIALSWNIWIYQRTPIDLTPPGFDPPVRTLVASGANNITTNTGEVAGDWTTGVFNIPWGPTPYVQFYVELISQSSEYTYDDSTLGIHTAGFNDRATPIAVPVTAFAQTGASVTFYLTEIVGFDS